jgi:aspartate racemase
MKTIGLIGGMSWESSLEYYRIINETIKEKLGGLHSAKCVLYSVDFAEMEKLQQEGRWDEAAKALIAAAKRLEKAGADFVIICTNTMHKVAEEVRRNIGIPLLHIADATAEKVIAKGIKTIGLLGTRFTMEEEFYVGRLVETYNLKVLIPKKDDRETIHRVIYEELCRGEIKQVSKRKYIDIMEKMKKEGAEGVILGCTEIELLIHQEDCGLPIFPTSKIHAEAAVEYSLEEQ